MSAPTSRSPIGAGGAISAHADLRDASGQCGESETWLVIGSAQCSGNGHLAIPGSSYNWNRAAGVRLRHPA